MKIDRRGVILMVLGAVQLLLGAFFVTIGAWAIRNSKEVVSKTQYVPFWMMGACFIDGYLLLVTPSQNQKCCILTLLNLLVISCILFTAVSGWMLAHALAVSSVNETTFVAVSISLSVASLVFNAIALGVTWSSKDRGFKKTSQNNANRPQLDPPPYWSHQSARERVVYVQHDNVAYIHSEGTPPPPPPYTE